MNAAREWLKRQDWYWKLYYRYGLRFGPRPNDRIWNVLVGPDDIPPPQEGYRQVIHHLPAHLWGRE